MSWSENSDKKRRGRKRKSDQGSGDEAFPGDLSFIGRRGKRGKRDVTTLEGYTYKETEGCVEIWEKEVKKGIKAKRAKCVGLIRDEKGEERICGKIFGRVPNCKRHVGVHQKSKGRGQTASEKNDNDDSFEILDDEDEDNLKGDSSSSEDQTKDPVEPVSTAVVSENQARQCNSCFKWKASSESTSEVSGARCLCSEKKQLQIPTAQTTRLFPAPAQLPIPNLADVVPSASGFCLPLTPPVHEPEIIWASDDDDSKDDEFDLSHYFDQKNDDLGGNLTDLIKMEWASFNDVLHFYAVANYN